MNLKKLTQAVFDGLPVEYRWAAVDSCGLACLHVYKPEMLTKRINPMWSSYADSTRIIGSDYDPTDWQNSLIERQDIPSVGCTGNPVDVPTADIDWSKAPEGATHYNTSSGAFFKRLDSGLVQVFAKTAGEWASLGAYTVFDLESSTYTIKRPESITDVARSIEAARSAEKSMPYPDGDARYFETSDAVNNPAHYTTGGIECIDAMQAMLTREEFIGYLRGNIFKYQWRYKHKNGVEDLRKADWYAQRLIQAEGAK